MDLGICFTTLNKGVSQHKHDDLMSDLHDYVHYKRPNQKWVGDITYIQTQKGWIYLAVVIDLYSRRVIRWAVSKYMKRDLVMLALQRTLALRKSPKA